MSKRDKQLEKRLRKAEQHKKKNPEWGKGKASKKARQELENAKKETGFLRETNNFSWWGI